MTLLDQAIIFAVKAHSGQKRKQKGLPFIVHPMEAAAIASSLTSDEEVIAAAVLHDTVEDTDTTAEQLKEFFGERVAALVGADSENKRSELPAAQTWKIRKQESLEAMRNDPDPDSKIIVLADKLSNMRSIYGNWKVMGNSVWNGFNQKDPSEQAWYYRSITDILSELSDTVAYQEYKRLVDEIFEGVE